MSENQLCKIEKVDPAVFFAPGSNAIDETLTKVRAHIETIVHDAATPEGRAAVVSLAREVSSCKAAIEKTGRAELKRLKASIKPIEAQVKKWADGMDAIRDDTRRPVTEIEEAEKAKLAEQRRLEEEAKAQRRRDLEQREQELKAKEEEIRQAELERQAEAQRKARAEELRQQDEANQIRVISEAVEDINNCLGSETVGSVVVALIEQGKIRHVTLNF